jgi:predicted amidohydrolase
MEFPDQTLTATPDPFLLAVVQMDPRLGDTHRNTDAILVGIAEAARTGAKAAIFPECALTGYVVDSIDQARAIAIPLHGGPLVAISAACRQHNLYAIIGALELDVETQDVYNSAWLVGPDGLVGCYRKTHLPVLGVDRFVTPGDSLPVFDLPFARVGVLICYDLRFPEAARALALDGADLIAVPTNWPEGAESAPEFLTRARAWENRVYIAACNRIGTERGVRFIGRSQIVSPDGRYLATADENAAHILTAEIVPAQARNKRLVIRAGEFELDPVGGRRPDLYRRLVTPAQAAPERV